MTIRRILLTGDDGYNSIGIRLMVHHLKDKYELLIAGTKSQQSGVGGKLSVFTGGEWGEGTVDGVKALWVSGTPADAIECARSYYRQKFDLVLSGINLGLNISDGFTSGTIAAAWRSIRLNITDRAMAFSWDAPNQFYNHTHQGGEHLADFLDHPGETAVQVVAKAIANQFWQSSFLNVNLPQKPSRQIKFARLLEHISDYYPDISLYQGKKKHYSYPHEGAIKKSFKSPDAYDAWVVNHGYISVTPFSPDLLDLEAYQKIAGKVISL